MAKNDAELAVHRAWLGMLQPVGLVVSPPALVKAQAVPERHVVGLQQELLGLVRQPLDAEDDAEPAITDVQGFFERVLGWPAGDLAGGPGGEPLPDDLELVLPEYHDTLRPTYAAVDPFADGDGPRFLLLVQVVDLDAELDQPAKASAEGWPASPSARLERLLRETGVAAGLLTNRRQLRLLYAPRGESSGHLTFPVGALCEVAGRPLLSALHLLLSEHRVFSAPDGRRLLDVLAASRKHQNEVSNKLSEQVLGALWDLLRGFQAADELAGGRLIDRVAREDPDHVYGGLLTVLLRLVFLLYAEDEGLMPDDPVYARNYSVTGLYERLREDAANHPDTLDQRFGAWAWLLSLFRLIYDGGQHGELRLPTRHGQLFNPDEHPFLEGRPYGVARVMGERVEVPRVSDGCLWRVLDALLVLDGERLSYRSLDVEQIGSVYEAMMGFSIERAFGASIAVRPKHIVVDVDALLEVPPGQRVKWLKDEAECALSGKSATALKEAVTADDVVAALGRKVSAATPRLLPPGGLYLQPGEERRRSGSHYTPRELTEPIVKTTLQPVLENLGEKPTPEQILDLKVCDPAMGSGAFLVEACRQLAEQVVEAWEVHGSMPEIPADEDPLLHARRLVAQRCLYGVDKNPFAVNLAKLSLWLVTLAKDHAFTFLDHALKCGDSLVGLTREQIGAFHWKRQERADEEPLARVVALVDTAASWRRKIRVLSEGDYASQREAWLEAEAALHEARLRGDLIVAAYFGAGKDPARDDLRLTYQKSVDDWKTGSIGVAPLRKIVDDLRQASRPVQPLHWQMEFPEVFSSSQGGFDAIVGNPPFLGGRRTTTVLGEDYRDWLALHPEASSNADLCSYFFRRAFDLLRPSGAFGLIATNTIAQGDTRASGLRWICTHGGEIFAARRRVKWPGLAAVVVSVVHVLKGTYAGSRRLDGRPVESITAFLFHRGVHDDPARLAANAGLSFVGSYVLGMGFTFDDTDKKGVATPLAEMERLLAERPENREVIFPYIGGSEVNTSPTHAHHRYVINFGERTEAEVRRRWPELMAIVEAKVKPERSKLKRKHLKLRWWQHAETRPALFAAVAGLDRVLAISRIGQHGTFMFLKSTIVFSEQLIVFPLSTHTHFCALQARPHEIWARCFGSSLEDRLRYTPSDCFETFPFPEDWATDQKLEEAGKTYYEYRAALMIENDEGLTKTYNRFHDPDERSPAILKLRDLHAAMDRAVLDAYGWSDISTDCEFLLDYEIDEETWGKKKKPYRYRWPEDVHDEVLARLLELNQQRAEAERLAGLTADENAKQAPAKRRRKKKAAALPLFDGPAEEEVG